MDKCCYVIKIYFGVLNFLVPYYSMDVDASKVRMLGMIPVAEHLRSERVMDSTLRALSGQHQQPTLNYSLQQSSYVLQFLVFQLQTIFEVHESESSLVGLRRPPSVILDAIATPERAASLCNFEDKPEMELEPMPRYSCSSTGPWTAEFIIVLWKSTIQRSPVNLVINYLYLCVVKTICKSRPLYFYELPTGSNHWKCWRRFFKLPSEIIFSLLNTRW